MPEEQKQEKSNVPVEQGYYKNTGSKVADFFIGLVGCPAVMWAGVMLATLQGSTAGDVGTGVAILFALGVAIISIYNGRKYIAIGLVSAVILPLLIVGGCLLVIYGVK